jgi:subtilisin family serine protease
VTIVNQDNRPVAEADVILVGKSGAVQAMTDSSGQARLTLFDEVPAAIEGLYVRPRADYWSYWISRPGLDLNQPTTVRLARLDQVFARFPDQPLVSWGLKAMRLDALPVEQFHGQGIRVALIDSGCANSHRNLRRVQAGLDMLESGNNRWAEDDLGHGTHCAGIIAADGMTSGIRGIAPRADLLPVKIHPYGRISDLIDALDQCIQRGIDIVALNFGTDERSALLERKIAEATDLGIACIAPVGDSGGPVRFPASLPTVVGVSVLGWRAAFPSDSFHSQAIGAGGGTNDGYFVARFSCSGPEVDVCGPGVAIVSAAPPDNYVALDGTALAPAHLVGLASLLLAHHADFVSGGAYSARNRHRVERLFYLLKASAQPSRIGDAWHTRCGLPDAIRALSTAANVPNPGLGVDGMHPMLQSLVGGAAWLGGTASDMQTAQVAAMLKRVDVSLGGRYEVQRMMESLERADLQDGPGARPSTLSASLTAEPSRVRQQLAEVLARVGL